MRVMLKPNSFRTIIFIFLIIFLFYCISIELYNVIKEAENQLNENTVNLKKLHKQAFITSSYFYSNSKSLGENSLGLIMSVNNDKQVDISSLTFFARNSTNNIVVNTEYLKVTPHEICRMITVFATVQLLPNVKTISMVGDDGLVEIPFSIPSYKPRNVVVCVSPLFISEQWQNFLFAAHIYRRFGAYMNLYLVSAIKSFYDLMKEYEKEDYVTIQEWVSVKFEGVSEDVIDPYNQIEFRNQAASQCDCLLKYKESADFVTFLDLDDVLIPKIAPNYHAEFMKLMKPEITFLYYHKENHDIDTVRDSSKFSLSRMIKTLEYKSARETGKTVVDPRKLNYTWIHFPPVMTDGMKKLEVESNVITHLKNVNWNDEYDKDKLLTEPTFYKNSSEKIIETEDIEHIEKDLIRMMKKPSIAKIFTKLPKERFYTDLIIKCYNEKYYRLHYAGRISEITCPGPQLCNYTQREDITCMRVNATYKEMPTISPISFYYATDAHFTTGMGCYPH